MSKRRILLVLIFCIFSYLNFSVLYCGPIGAPEESIEGGREEPAAEVDEAAEQEKAKADEQRRQYDESGRQARDAMERADKMGDGNINQKMPERQKAIELLRQRFEKYPSVESFKSLVDAVDQLTSDYEKDLGRYEKRRKGLFGRRFAGKVDAIKEEMSNLKKIVGETAESLSETMDGEGRKGRFLESYREGTPSGENLGEAVGEVKKIASIYSAQVEYAADHDDDGLSYEGPLKELNKFLNQPTVIKILDAHEGVEESSPAERPQEAQSGTLARESSELGSFDVAPEEHVAGREKPAENEEGEEDDDDDVFSDARTGKEEKPAEQEEHVAEHEKPAEQEEHVAEHEKSAENEEGEEEDDDDDDFSDAQEIPEKLCEPGEIVTAQEVGLTPEEEGRLAKEAEAVENEVDGIAKQSLMKRMVTRVAELSKEGAVYASAVVSPERALSVAEAMEMAGEVGDLVERIHKLMSEIDALASGDEGFLQTMRDALVIQRQVISVTLEELSEKIEYYTQWLHGRGHWSGKAIRIASAKGLDSTLDMVQGWSKQIKAASVSLSEAGEIADPSGRPLGRLVTEDGSIVGLKKMLQQVGEHGKALREKIEATHSTISATAEAGKNAMGDNVHGAVERVIGKAGAHVVSVAAGVGHRVSEAIVGERITGAVEGLGKGAVDATVAVGRWGLSFFRSVEPVEEPVVSATKESETGEDDDDEDDDDFFDAHDGTEEGEEEESVESERHAIEGAAGEEQSLSPLEAMRGYLDAMKKGILAAEGKVAEIEATQAEVSVASTPRILPTSDQESRPEAGVGVEGEHSAREISSGLTDIEHEFVEEGVAEWREKELKNQTKKEIAEAKRKDEQISRDEAKKRANEELDKQEGAQRDKITGDVLNKRDEVDENIDEISKLQDAISDLLNKDTSSLSVKEKRNLEKNLKELTDALEFRLHRARMEVRDLRDFTARRAGEVRTMNSFLDACRNREHIANLIPGGRELVSWVGEALHTPEGVKRDWYPLSERDQSAWMEGEGGRAVATEAAGEHERRSKGKLILRDQDEVYDKAQKWLKDRVVARKRELEEQMKAAIEPGSRGKKPKLTDREKDEIAAQAKEDANREYPDKYKEIEAEITQRKVSALATEEGAKNAIREAIKQGRSEREATRIAARQEEVYEGSSGDWIKELVRKVGKGLMDRVGTLAERYANEVAPKEENLKISRSTLEVYRGDISDAQGILSRARDRIPRTAGAINPDVLSKATSLASRLSGRAK